jgi:hypothetical protein
MEDHDEDAEPTLVRALTFLPLFEGNIFLKMQADNIAVVDVYLRELELNLLREYVEKENTPVPSALFVAVLSQMWVFAAYELLRTWRQMVREIVEGAGRSPGERNQGAKPSRRKRGKKVDRPRISEELTETFYDAPLRGAASRPGIVAALRRARAGIDPAFRRLTEVRIALATHEIAGATGFRALAPGYSRVDMATGSIYWMVDTKDGTSEIIARRDLAGEFQRCCSPEGAR